MLGPTQGSEVVTGLQGVPSTRAGSIQPWGKGSRDSSAVSRAASPSLAHLHLSVHICAAGPLALNMAGVLRGFTPLWQSERSLPKEEQWAGPGPVSQEVSSLGYAAQAQPRNSYLRRLGWLGTWERLRAASRTCPGDRPASLQAAAWSQVPQGLALPVRPGVARGFAITEDGPQQSSDLTALCTQGTLRPCEPRAWNSRVVGRAVGVAMGRLTRVWENSSGGGRPLAREGPRSGFAFEGCELARGQCKQGCRAKGL